MHTTNISHNNKYTFSNPNLQALELETNRVWGNTNIYNTLGKSKTSTSSNASNSSTYIASNVSSSGSCMIHTSYGCQPRISGVIG